MKRGLVVPRISFPMGPMALPIHDPLFEPIEPAHSSIEDGETRAWLALVTYLSALGSFYTQIGAGARICDRLNDLAALAAQGANTYVLPQFVREAAVIGRVTGNRADGSPGAGEASWWATAAQAAFALSVWYGLEEEAHPDTGTPLAICWDLSKAIRAGVKVLFLAPIDAAILNAATGDGAGDLLAMVATVQVQLDTIRPLAPVANP